LVFSHSVTKTSLPIGTPYARRPNSVVPSSLSVDPSGILAASRLFSKLFFIRDVEVKCERANVHFSNFGRWRKNHNKNVTKS